MKNIIKNNIIEIEPLIYIGGVYCKTIKEIRFYKIINAITVISSLIGIMLFILLITYISHLKIFFV